MRVPASPGLENRPVLLIQSHLDMVAAVEDGVSFDFLTDPINLEIDGNMLRGAGTNLGSDNGVGVASMMAVAFSEDIPHPALELLFTVREETGLMGIRGFDTAKLRARRMINMDCGSSHSICISSAGCKKCSASASLTTADAAGLQALRLTISGGLGGHSGLMIAAGRMCAANLLGDLLTRLSAEFDIRLARAMPLGRAILPGADAVICIDAAAACALRARIDEVAAELFAAYLDADPEVSIHVADIESVSAALDEASTRTAARALSCVRSAPTHMDENTPGVIITSSVVTGFSLSGTEFTLDYTVRSESDTERDALFASCSADLAALGLTTRVLDGYDGWPCHADSPLRETIAALHRRIHGSEMSMSRIHGGIETGIILGTVPDMDAVGFKPSSQGAHTTSECLLLDEVLPFWQVFTALLAE